MSLIVFEEKLNQLIKEFRNTHKGSKNGLYVTFANHSFCFLSELSGAEGKQSINTIMSHLQFCLIHYYGLNIDDVSEITKIINKKKKKELYIK